MALRDLIEVPRIETVVQLMAAESGTPEAARRLLSSFVLTEEIERGLHQVLERLRDRNGCGVFVKGSYGAGKSHFLAFLSLLLEAGEPPAGLSHPAVTDHFARGTR